MSIKSSLVYKRVVVCVALFFLLGYTEQIESDSLKSLESIVVTGTKSEKLITLTPVKTEIISKDDIERFAACNLYQVLDGSPGIRMEQQCNNCNFGVMRMSGLEGGYAKILIDGMPVFSGLASVYGMQQIQAGLIERIEIVKGAGSALYGSDAIAGVVNVITKKPSSKPSLVIGSSIGINPISDKDKNGDIPLTSSVNFSAAHRKDNFAAIIAGQSNTSDEIDNNNDMATDRVNSVNLGGTTQLYFYDALGSKSLVGLMGRVIYEKRKGGGIETDSLGNFPMDNPLSPVGPGSEQIITERFEGGLNLEKELTSQTALRGMLSVVSHQRNATNGAAWEKLTGDNLNFDSLTEDNWMELSSKFPQAFLTNEQTVVGEVNVSQPIGDKNTIMAGVQLKRTDVDENINATGWANRYFQDIGLFIQDDWDIVDKFSVVAGLRYDMHKSEDDAVNSKYNEDALNPRVSMRFTPFESLVTRFSWGMGFRVPGDFSEDAHLCASAPSIQKNSTLDPERAMSFNLSADFSKKDFTFSTMLFRTNIEDKVVLTDYNGTDGGYDLEWVNAEGKAYTQGFEISAEYDFDFLSLDADYVLTNAQYEDEQDNGVEESKYIPRVPTHTGNLNITLFSDPSGDSFGDGWSFDLGGRIVGSMYIGRDGDIVEAAANGDYGPEVELESIVKSDPYLLLNARINKRINEAGIDIYISAENLSNTVQEREPWDIDDAAMIYAPLYGTTLTAGFKKQF